MREDLEEEQPWGRGKSKLHAISFEFLVLDGSGTAGHGINRLFGDVPSWICALQG